MSKQKIYVCPKCGIETDEATVMRYIEIPCPRCGICSHGDFELKKADADSKRRD